MAPPITLNTVRDVRTAMEPYADIPLTTACAMLGTRRFDDENGATPLEPSERDRFERLLDLIEAATGRTKKGYVGLRWTTIRAEELGGQTAIEALKTEGGTRAVMTILERRQEQLADELAAQTSSGAAEDDTDGRP